MILLLSTSESASKRTRAPIPTAMIRMNLSARHRIRSTAVTRQSLWKPFAACQRHRNIAMRFGCTRTAPCGPTIYS